MIKKCHSLKRDCITYSIKEDYSIKIITQGSTKSLAATPISTSPFSDDNTLDASKVSKCTQSQLPIDYDDHLVQGVSGVMFRAAVSSDLFSHHADSSASANSGRAL